MTDRRVVLDGPVNFRDIGGYATTSGSTVKWGRVYRSDSLHHLTVEDGPRLAKIGIVTALDFRAHDELDRIGIGRLGDLDIKHVHVPTVDQVLHTVRPPDAVVPGSVAEIYLRMMEAGSKAYAAALRTLVEPDALPAVYFCMAGKDRTGVFSAFLLGLLGVGDLDIVADYVLTQGVVDKIHERGRAERAGMPDLPDRDKIWEEMPEDLLGAKAPSMEGLLAGVHAKYSSWLGYANAIGIEEDVILGVRELLLERVTRFGLQLPNFTLGVPDTELFARVAEQATAGEESGFSSLWVMDHFYQLPALGGADQAMLEGYTLLGALAARTERIELGTLVTGVTYRNPAMLAKMVTTLDIISSGRAILGIGAAWHDVEHEGLGFDFPPVKERMDRLEEAVQICRAMFTEDAPTFEGKYYSIREARNLPRPIRPGGPRIMIGGGGEKRTLKLVAQYADLCNVSGDVEMIRHKLEVLRGHCADVGRDPSEIATTRLGTLMLTDSAEQTQQTQSFLTEMAGAEFAAACTVGTDDEVVEQVAALLDAGLDELIFNLPTADPAGIRRAGALLTSTFG